METVTETYTTANLYMVAAAVIDGVPYNDSRFEMGKRLLVSFDSSRIEDFLTKWKNGNMNLDARKYGDVLRFLFRCAKRKETLPLVFTL